MKKLISLTFLLMLTATTFAQNNEPQMADTMRSDGKIYVVVLVLSVVFACLATYLIIIDRKLKKLEDTFDKKLN
ncbi:MAG TPA: CcmD family protein [Bacteroidia bacterium]|nr:CcmD family protein [Bacteroidia bacterium]